MDLPAPQPAGPRDRVRLAVATTGLVLVETAALSRLGPATGLALAPQVSAPMPLDVFHDLRWLAVYTARWWAVLGVLVGLVALRTLWTAAIVGWAWPADLARPSRRERIRRALVATAIVVVVLVPWVVLTFTTAVLSLSYTWIVAIPVVVMISFVVHGAAVRPDWWRIRPPGRALGPVAVAVGAVTAVGAVVSAAPAWVRWPAVVIAGLVNAWCWARVVDATARVTRVSRRPFAVVALAGILVLVVGGAAIGFTVAIALERDRAPTPRAAPLAVGSGPPVLVVKGFNSQWDGVERQWVRGDFRIRRFSYAGTDTRGRPLPYDRESTHAAVDTLARRMRAQVATLAEETGEPVGIVAESEGSLVALTYLLATPDAPVDAIVVLSPLLAPGRVAYPEPGHAGWGIAAGALIDGVAAVVERLGPVAVRSDTPLFRSMVTEAPLFQGLLRCPAPGVRALAVLPVDTGLAAPEPTRIALPSVVRPAFHGGLLGDDVTARLVARTMRGRAVDTTTRWRGVARGVQALAAPWQVPSLVPALEPAWRDLPDPDDCTAVRRGLRAYVDG